MALVEILDVALAELDAEQLRGRNIEVPKPGRSIDGDTILVVGWVLGRSSPASNVEVVHDGTVLQKAELDVQRPDIVAAFPEVPGAEESGFRTRVAIPEADEFELLVQAVSQDESRVQLGVIKVRQSQSAEEQYGKSSVQERSGPVQEQLGPVAKIFQRLLGRRVG